MPAPRRLRRTEINQTPPPPDALVRAGVTHDRPPVEMQRGLPHGSSLRGAGDSYLELEKDNVEGTFTSGPTPPSWPTPFANLRRDK